MNLEAAITLAIASAFAWDGWRRWIALEASKIPTLDRVKAIEIKMRNLDTSLEEALKAHAQSVKEQIAAIQTSTSFQDAAAMQGVRMHMR